MTTKVRYSNEKNTEGFLNGIFGSLNGTYGFLYFPR
jgi:hypothetical protein